MEKTIYNLKLHEELEIQKGQLNFIQRVPGGWNYVYLYGVQFVPLNNEFQPKKEKPKIETLEERKIKFEQSLFKYIDLYGDVMIVEFIDYWTESSQTGNKMRFEKEKVFDFSRRLKTWKSRQFKSKLDKSILDKTYDEDYKLFNPLK